MFADVGAVFIVAGFVDDMPFDSAGISWGLKPKSSRARWLPQDSCRWKQVVLEEGGLDSGHGERDWLNVVGRQSVAPGKFNIPNIEGILVLDKGKALTGAGAFVR